MKDRSPDIRYFESFLRRCLYEAKDFRNDGWVKSHYENEIKLAAELANQAANVFTASITDPALVDVRTNVYRKLVLVVFTERTIEQSLITRNPVLAQAGRNYLEFFFMHAVILYPMYNPLSRVFFKNLDATESDDYGICSIISSRLWVAFIG